MSRLDQPGGFGGPRIVRPQANVYTVLLLVACLFVAFALVVELMRLRKLREPASATPTVTMSVQQPGAMAGPIHTPGPIAPLG